VGARGARVKTIVRGARRRRRSDIVKFFPDPRDMIIEALKPAVPREIVVDEKKRNRILLKVATDDLAIAIGRKGQNARLTSRLIGWRLDIEEFRAAGDDPRGTAIASLVRKYEFDPPSPRVWSTWHQLARGLRRSRGRRPRGRRFTAEEAQTIVDRVAAKQSSRGPLIPRPRRPPVSAQTQTTE